MTKEERRQAMKARKDEEERANNQGYHGLANAIIALAYKDYVNALLISRDPERDCKGLHDWFFSDWYRELTNVDGSYLVRKANEEVHYIRELARIRHEPEFERLFNKYKYEGKISINKHEMNKFRSHESSRRTLMMYQARMKKNEDITSDKRFTHLVDIWKTLEGSISQTQFKKDHEDELRSIATDYKGCGGVYGIGKMIFCKARYDELAEELEEEQNVEEN